MAVVRALFLSQTNATLSPVETAHNIHDLLLKVSTTADMFVTAFYAKLDYVARQMSYIRGGHDRPVYYHAASRQVGLLDAPGRFLGLLPNLIVEESNLTFETGDTLVCYSDGVTDAVCPEDGEMYGLERLENIVSQNGHRSAQELVDTIVNDVDNFRNDAEQPDDLTLLVTKAM
jgi:sigma-B regulation protein RsbU (phosphoserine phosphatase)